MTPVLILLIIFSFIRAFFHEVRRKIILITTTIITIGLSLGFAYFVVSDVPGATLLIGSPAVAFIFTALSAVILFLAIPWIIVKAILISIKTISGVKTEKRLAIISMWLVLVQIFIFLLIFAAGIYILLIPFIISGVAMIVCCIVSCVMSVVKSNKPYKMAIFGIVIGYCVSAVGTFLLLYSPTLGLK